MIIPLTAAAMTLMLIYEKLRPANALNSFTYWWLKAIALNGCQALVALLKRLRPWL